ncbi:MAG: hypothetical protein IKO91_00755 [Oscillospiraceae bacterium]|nr:hypothetical protein [Oscillospiraceae bacterium]
MRKQNASRRAATLLLLPALLLSLCACGPGNGRRIKSGAAAQAPSVAIRHFDLDAGNENAELFFEIPVLTEASSAADRFNDFFLSLYGDFAEKELGRVREILASAAPGTPSAENPYRDCWTAQVRDCSQRWISISLSYDWYMGGVLDYGINGYAFDRLSGERLYLNDLLPGSEDRIKSVIACGLKEKYPELVEMADFQGNTPLDALEKLTVPEIDFFIAEGGVITVVFDKYELAPGAAGMLIVPLPGDVAWETVRI